MGIAISFCRIPKKSGLSAGFCEREKALPFPALIDTRRKSKREPFLAPRQRKPAFSALPTKKDRVSRETRQNRQKALFRILAKAKKQASAPSPPHRSAKADLHPFSALPETQKQTYTPFPAPRSAKGKLSPLARLFGLQKEVNLYPFPVPNEEARLARAPHSAKRKGKRMPPKSGANVSRETQGVFRPLFCLSLPPSPRPLSFRRTACFT